MIQIRPATPADAPFLVNIIQSAEAVEDQCTFQRIYQLTYEELNEVLTELVLDDSGDQELSYVHFAIAQSDNQAVGACAAWIEPTDGPSSGLSRQQYLLFMPCIGKEGLKKAQSSLDLISKVTPQRKPGSIQLDSFGVIEDFRGQGIVSQLIHYQLNRLKSDLAQIILMSNNESALKAYQKAGFSETQHLSLNKPELSLLLGGNAKTLLEKKL